VTCPDDAHQQAAIDVSKPHERKYPPQPPMSPGAPHRDAPTKLVKMAEFDTLVQGGLPPEIVKRILRANFRRIRACYEDALKRAGVDALEGIVDIELWIDGSSGFTRADTHGGSTNIADEAMVTCVQRIAACLSFPKAETSTRVHYPLRFSSRNGPSQPVVYVAGGVLVTPRFTFENGTSTLDAWTRTRIDDVAAFIVHEGKDIELLEIHAHTRSGGDEGRNLKLSEERAAAVVAALVARGVDTKRLRARGYGSACPLPAGTADPEFDERVEFTILRMSGKDTGAKPACAAKAP
jgi:outer membrane protein OmpA-like peptidoglycan-associated protein